MTRVKLTKKMAETIRKTRAAVNVSQYELADALGWVRSKIKRLEKAEVATIGVEDLMMLENVFQLQWDQKVDFNVQESSSNKAVPAKGSSKKTVLSPTEKKSSSKTKMGALFSSVRHLPERKLGLKSSQVFFEVTVVKTMTAEELLGVRRIELLGVEGSINGVENTQNQIPIRAGDRVVIMLWSPGSTVTGSLGFTKTARRRAS